MRKLLNLFLSSCLLGVLLITFDLKMVAAEQQKTVVGETALQLSIEDQKKAAYEILKEILELSESDERREKLPEIKVLYRKIIERYPDLALAQECYLRLVVLAKEENTPQGDEEAARVYQEFIRKYPNSRLQRIIKNELEKN